MVQEYVTLKNMDFIWNEVNNLNQTATIHVCVWRTGVPILIRLRTDNGPVPVTTLLHCLLVYPHWRVVEAETLAQGTS